MNYACNIHTYEDQALAFELFFYFRYEKSYGYNNDEMTPKNTLSIRRNIFRLV